MRLNFSTHIAFKNEVYYGFVEACIISLYCICSWKKGWTKAPTDVSLWEALTTSYEIKVIEEAETSLENDDGIQVPTVTVTKADDSNKDAWDYVDYGDAEMSKPNAKDVKNEESTSKSWFGFT